MKKLIILALFVSIFASCDKVKHPDQRPPVIPHCVDSINMVVKNNSTINGSRKILIEDYTGHQCINCPRAAEAAEAIVTANPGKVVVLANHVTGTFAAPYNDSVYKEEFRNPTSTAWDAAFGMSSSSGLPIGMVNRQTPFPQHYPAWASLAGPALAKPWSAKLDITTYYDTVKYYINVKVKTTFKTAWPNDVNLIVAFTQDNIISDQKDGAPPVGSTMDPNLAAHRLNYRFDNIVLGAFDPFGEMIKQGPVNANDTITKSYGCFLLAKNFFNKPSLPIVTINDKYINAVAFVYDAVTKEVLQVEKLKIR